MQIRDLVKVFAARTVIRSEADWAQPTTLMSGISLTQINSELTNNRYFKVHFFHFLGNPDKKL